MSSDVALLGKGEEEGPRSEKRRDLRNDGRAIVNVGEKTINGINSYDIFQRHIGVAIVGMEEEKRREEEGGGVGDEGAGGDSCDDIAAHEIGKLETDGTKERKT